MNFNISVLCDVCTQQTNCRLGLSNRAHQPLRFRCRTCGAPIDVTMTPDFEAITCDINVTGATQIPGEKFKPDVNFVDLHLDFPVSFEPYRMGHTPYMKAMERIGHESMHLHAARLHYLNEVYETSPEIKALFVLYAKDKLDLFREKVWAFLGKKMPCNTQLDVNRALYYASEKAFFPFAEPGKNVESVEGTTRLQLRLEKKDKVALHAFMTEIVDSGFLRNAQLDCLEIYPRIIDIELMLRPALFLDFDRTYRAKTVPYRVSALEFNDAKDLFKDMTEIMSRLLVLVAGMNNLNRRGDHNLFAPAKNAPANLKAYVDLPLGFKLQQIDQPWYRVNVDAIDNRLRNSIAHYKAEYNEITQELVYYPKQEGLEQATSVHMHFLDFSRKLLEVFRELHRLNHLVKCLFVYYMRMVGVAGTSIHANDPTPQQGDRGASTEA
jgi:hypothetical protein